MKNWQIILIGLLLVGSFVFAQVDDMPERIVTYADPRDNNIILDGFTVGAVGAFSSPQRPVLFNPASLGSVPQTQLAFDHNRYFWGIGDVLYSSSMIYAQHFVNRGFGVSLGYFGSDNLGTQSIIAHYGQRITRAKDPWSETRRLGLFAGISLGIRNRSYNEDNFTLEDPDDPLFQQGLSRMGLSLSGGLIFQQEHYRVYITGQDLNSPNMALESGEEDRIPMVIQAGADINTGFYDLRVSPLISYHSEYGDFSKDFDPTVTIRRTFLEDQFEMGVFGGRWAVGLGVNYYLGKKTGPGFGYELTMPTTGIGVPSHRLMVTYRFSPPPPSYSDLLIGNISTSGKPTVGGNVKFDVEVRNDGIRDANNVPVNFFADGKSLGVVKVPKVPAKSSVKAFFEWEPDKAGSYRVQVRADDAGGKYPEYESKVLELDETNNANCCSTRIYGPPIPVLDADPGNLLVTQFIALTEDEPVVPIVFFDEKNDEVTPRFDNTLELIADRLMENPDATLMIEGYYGPDEKFESFTAGSTLAMQRANNVASKLVEYHPELNSRVRINEDHDITRPRAVKQDFQGTKLGRRYTAQENRRVEMKVYPAPPREWLIDEKLPSNSDIEAIRKHLDNNPMFELVVTAPTLKDAFQQSKFITEELGVNNGKRVYSRESADEKSKLVVTAGAILYKPHSYEIPDSELRIEPGFEKTEFSTKLLQGGPISHSYLQVRDDRNQQIWHMENPEELMSSAKWDWTDKSGKLINKEQTYFADITVKDIYGQIGQSARETLNVALANQHEISERLILVQFTFAEAFGEPDYASVRMEQMARKVLRRVMDEEPVRVVIGGHTDIVGVESGNVKLSVRRAEEQMKTLRYYLQLILGLDDDDDLDRWLAANNSVITSRGYGPSNPYEVTRGKGESATRRLLGDNSTPEGRIINRRVEIVFTPLRE